MVTGFFPKQKAYIEKEIGTGILKTSDRDFEKEELWHKQMLDGGFKYNEEFNFYFSKDGALMDDTNATLAEYFSNERHLECITNGNNTVSIFNTFVSMLNVYVFNSL